MFAGDRDDDRQPYACNAVDLHGRRPTVAAGTTSPSPGALTLTDGNINTGTVAAQGSISQASTFDGGTGTLLIDGTADQTFTGAATPAAGNLPERGHRQALGHAHPGRHDPDRRRNWTYTAGTLDPGTLDASCSPAT